MKRSSKWLKVFNGLLSSVLALLGYSCNVLGETPDEYGTPYARYEVKGKVTDKENQSAVEGARVIVKPLSYETGIASPYNNDTVYTDNDGNYLYQKEGSGLERLRVVCEDPSDTYKADSTQVSMNPKGGDGWYQGSDSQIVDFELDKKEP